MTHSFWRVWRRCGANSAIGVRLAPAVLLALGFANYGLAWWHGRAAANRLRGMGRPHSPKIPALPLKLFPLGRMGNFAIVKS
jgi:hypothetical protein